MDIIYGTICIFAYIFVNINNHFSLYNFNARKDFSLRNLYEIKITYEFTTTNFILLCICAFSELACTIIVLCKIVTVIIFLKKNTHIYNMNEFILYVFIFFTSNLYINILLSTFGILFSRPQIVMVDC